jgi:hypothetical protein
MEIYGCSVGFGVHGAICMHSRDDVHDKGGKLTYVSTLIKTKRNISAISKDTHESLGDSLWRRVAITNGNR